MIRNLTLGPLVRQVFFPVMLNRFANLRPLSFRFGNLDKSVRKDCQYVNPRYKKKLSLVNPNHIGEGGAFQAMFLKQLNYSKNVTQILSLNTFVNSILVYILYQYGTLSLYKNCIFKISGGEGGGGGKLSHIYEIFKYDQG